MQRDRRQFLALLASAWAAPALAQTPSPAGRAQALSPEMSRPTAYAFSFKRLEGGDLRLAEQAGKPILVVNTASLCGYTPQYEGLQQLWTRFRGQGLLVIGVPSNDFGGQEPGGPAEIGHTAHGKYGVTFPLAEKVAVKGAAAHPFYKWAAGERPLEVPRWNFHKYLIGRDGHIAAAFSPDIEASDARIVAAVARELRPPAR
ncbi:MAG TPA: glutathione peroxidase [Xanthobacteraceae bacterium]|nr:glutathione peroxidase [Xanthobacteraceae bacterium]